jgi:hypothetical protein
MGLTEIAAVVMLVLTCLVVFGGLGWLLFRRCQISIVQVLFGIVVFALLLVPWRAWALRRDDPNPEERFAVGAFCLAVLLGAGLFLGARNTRGLGTTRTAWRWLTFGAGLFLPLTISAWLVAVPSSSFLGVPDPPPNWAALCLSLLLLAETTVLLVNWVRIMRGQGM